MPIYPGDKSSLYFPRPRLLSSPRPPCPGCGAGTGHRLGPVISPHYRIFAAQLLRTVFTPAEATGELQLLTVSSRLSQTIITINTEPPLTRKQGQNNQTTIFIIPHRRVPALPHCWEIHYDAPGRVGQHIPSYPRNA